MTINLKKEKIKMKKKYLKPEFEAVKIANDLMLTLSDNTPALQDGEVLGHEMEFSEWDENQFSE